MAELTIRQRTATAQYFTEDLGNGVGLDMVLVPGDTFLMGSPENEPQRSDSEGPQHEVTVSTFLMGRYTVTQAQWRAVAAMTQVKIELKSDPANFKGDNRPVERVSWYEAEEFCERLAVHTRRPYRLPSEAQWEYACRAGTQTPFYFGQTLTDEVANYRATSTYKNGPKGKFLEETVDVTHFGLANAYGLCDMHGNVDEWCADHWHGSYDKAPTDGSPWLSQDSEASRVLRGGSWISSPWVCRSASRVYGLPGYRDSYIGFRVSCEPPGL
ncbi:formylglycine-generating enzyme family protein [Leptothoe spongobia]|uniref:Formylglycine-generating enzyme family protein n=1 Tax=Leptothoe spongobia TAU-MAC 1115 TaxID=1967444 RepID=A0A947DDC1_9CYAN|nr:formylglycine-generating enzyme family protein [Leptothoe spongobia]MBT9314897.1 formylglycine-generating enzyme family protein [Leptothoe spongobia TAU-MAC 1115]